MACVGDFWLVVSVLGSFWSPFPRWTNVSDDVVGISKPGIFMRLAFLRLRCFGFWWFFFGSLFWGLGCLGARVIFLGLNLVVWFGWFDVCLAL